MPAKPARMTKTSKMPWTSFLKNWKRTSRNTLLFVSIKSINWRQEKPDDFVIATGVQHTVRDFTEKAFAANGITLRWEGTGIDEKGYDVATGKMLICVNPQWFRPTDVDNLWGDPTKAKTVLGWNPQSTTYEQLVEIMAKHDRERAKREKALKAVL